MRDVSAEADAPPFSQRRVRLGMLERPRVRGDCETGPRPCPWVSCRQHLYLDVPPSGFVRLNFPDLEPGELRDSCALDVAEQGGVTPEVVGALLNVSGDEAQQIEERALALPHVVEPLAVFAKARTRREPRRQREQA